MRTPDEWFEAYGVSHQNTTNKALHWVCIPLIMISLIGLLWSIPFSYGSWLNVGTIFVVLCCLFYFRLSFSLGVGMLVVTAVMIAIVRYLQTNVSLPLGVVSLGIFVLAWVGQFIGHKIEGKKPSFLEDLQFLLIGPLWLLGFIYRRLHIPY